jgi:hypothetical protein
MPRKKRQETETVSSEADAAATTVAVPQGVAATPANETAASGENQDQAEQKNWGPPYKAIFVSKDKGFEMGENRRFRQRVFLFKHKPGEKVLAALKENGFTYRIGEKAWTIPANPATREISDRLAREFAGEGQEISR